MRENILPIVSTKMVEGPKSQRNQLILMNSVEQTRDYWLHIIFEGWKGRETKL